MKRARKNIALRFHEMDIPKWTLDHAELND